MGDRDIGTAVIGGSQAGLAVGYHLRRRGLPFVILDENARIGDAWRKRWDSLRLEKLTKVGARFEVSCCERTLYAENVVLATGAFAHPRVPSFARELDQNIVQLHSKQYRNPSQVQDGGVLVVGAGNSGAEIAIELARDHQTWLSGRDTGQEPTRAGSLPDHLVTPITTPTISSARRA